MHRIENPEHKTNIVRKSKLYNVNMLNICQLMLQGVWQEIREKLVMKIKCAQKTINIKTNGVQNYNFKR